MRCVAHCVVVCDGWRVTLVVTCVALQATSSVGCTVPGAVAALPLCVLLTADCVRCRCLEPWATHNPAMTGGYYQCNIFEEK
jgi:hypothetical protein